MNKFIKGYVKRVLAYIMVIGMIVGMTGCELLEKDDERVGISNRGLVYCFEGDEVPAIDANIDDDITYMAPEMRCESDKNIRAYVTETEILFIWLGKKADKIDSEDVLTKYSKALTKYICTFADIETVDVSYDLDMIAEDTVNNIERKKYTGAITGINESGIDVALRSSIYTFVVNNRPGCVLGLVLDNSQSDEKYNEVDSNTQVMINSMTAK